MPQPPTHTHKGSCYIVVCVQKNYFHLFHFTAVTLWLRGGTPKPDGLGFNPGLATDWLFELEQVPFSATVFSSVQQ